MRIGKTLTVAACAVLVLVGGAWAKGALDAGLYTEYQPETSELQYTVCGTVGDSTGCFGGGVLQPFEQVCAVLEGAPKTKGNVMTRAVYVMDKRHSSSNPALLYVYTRTDTFSADGDTVETALNKTITLDFDGGQKTSCQLAGNDVQVFAGVVGEANYDVIDKKKLTAMPSGESLPLISFKADDRGYISANFGGTGEYVIFDPKGIGRNGGPGVEYISGTHNGLTF
jgi:hypothetical protein